jgi:hypothetical protein
VGYAIDSIEHTFSTYPSSIDEEASLKSRGGCIADIAGSMFSKIVLGEEHE